MPPAFRPQRLDASYLQMELDYGLAGADLQPKDQLLVACNSLAAGRLIRAVQEATGQGVGGASTTAREAVRGYTLIQTK